ncbi:menaquinone biosynthesis decarboxylase [bacterium]|nr:menaquinone biosynthesis decarboxylase [bacterium]|tara:strand:+ start:1123 stop:2559 length:1437 start_codon:yes stop_codon:yes gene_type:complete
MKNLSEYIKHLEKKNQLKRISEEIDPKIEITVIGEHYTRNNKEALLFENIKGSNFPLAVNLFGSKDRVSQAFGVNHIDEHSERIEQLLKPPKVSGILDAMSMLPKFAELGKQLIPKTIKKAPCQEIVLKGDDANLDILPIPTLWPKDAGPYICLGSTITNDPETGSRNVGLYRLQKHDKKTLGMHWQLHKDGKRHEVKASQKKEKIPVAIAIGGDPATMYSASAPLPPGIDEYLLAGFLNKKPVEVVKCITSDIKVPAHAEFILEGWVDPDERREEGPFGDHTGFYSHPGPYPVFHLELITHRKKPVFPHIIVGKPLQEDWFLGWATERIFLPLVRLFCSEIKDMHFPAEGVFHNMLLVSIKKSYPGQARKVIHAIWGIGLLSLTKFIVVVDEDVDVQNPSETTFHALSNIDPQRDIVMDSGPVDVLDHASPVEGFGSKIGFDGTRKIKGESAIREWPEQVDIDQQKIDAILKKIKDN